MENFAKEQLPLSNQASLSLSEAWTLLHEAYPLNVKKTPKKELCFFTSIPTDFKIPQSDFDALIERLRFLNSNNAPATLHKDLCRKVQTLLLKWQMDSIDTLYLMLQNEILREIDLTRVDSNGFHALYYLVFSNIQSDILCIKILTLINLPYEKYFLSDVVPLLFGRDFKTFSLFDFLSLANKLDTIKPIKEYINRGDEIKNKARFNSCLITTIDDAITSFDLGRYAHVDSIPCNVFASYRINLPSSMRYNNVVLTYEQRLIETFNESIKEWLQMVFNLDLYDKNNHYSLLGCLKGMYAISLTGGDLTLEEMLQHLVSMNGFMNDFMNDLLMVITILEVLSIFLIHIKLLKNDDTSDTAKMLRTVTPMVIRLMGSFLDDGGAHQAISTSLSLFYSELKPLKKSPVLVALAVVLNKHSLALKYKSQTDFEKELNILDRIVASFFEIKRKKNKQLTQLAMNKYYASRNLYNYLVGDSLPVDVVSSSDFFKETNVAVYEQLFRREFEAFRNVLYDFFAVMLIFDSNTRKVEYSSEKISLLFLVEVAYASDYVAWGRYGGFQRKRIADGTGVVKDGKKTNLMVPFEEMIQALMNAVREEYQCVMDKKKSKVEEVEAKVDKAKVEKEIRVIPDSSETTPVVSEDTPKSSKNDQKIRSIDRNKTQKSLSELKFDITVRIWVLRLTGWLLNRRESVASKKTVLRSLLTWVVQAEKYINEGDNVIAQPESQSSALTPLDASDISQTDGIDTHRGLSLFTSKEKPTATRALLDKGRFISNQLFPVN